MFTILIPTDYSKGAANAIRYALQLTKKLPCKIVFFHGELIPVPPNAEVSLMPLDVDREAVRGLLEKNIQRILKTEQVGKSQKHVYDISDGASISFQILEAAEKHRADLIVMGTQGASGLAKYLLGSNTTDVISNSKIPVLAVPASYRYKPLKKILYASNLRQFNSQLNEILAWTRLFGAQLDIVYVSNNPDEEAKLITNAQKTIERKPDKKIKFFVIAFADKKSVTQELKSALKEHQSDMAVLFRHEHNWLGRMLMKSITEKLAFEINVPLMAFQAEP